MPFKPGVSGNPSGGPKKANRAAMLARQHTEESIQALIDALGDEKTENRIKAASTLLDRGWGKPQEYIEVSQDGEQVATMEQNIVNKLLAAMPEDVLQKLADEYSGLEDHASTH